MFKKSGRGAKKAYCINEACKAFVPEEKRGGYKKKTVGDDQAVKEKKAAKKTAGKKTVAKKAAAKKSPAKKTAEEN